MAGALVASSVHALQLRIDERVVDVADRHDVLTHEPTRVAAAHAAESDGGDVDRVAGRLEPAAEHMPRQNGQARSRGGRRKEPASRDVAHEISSQSRILPPCSTIQAVRKRVATSLLTLLLMSMAAPATCFGWEPSAADRLACCKQAQHAKCADQTRADDCCAGQEEARQSASQLASTTATFPQPLAVVDLPFTTAWPERAALTLELRARALPARQIFLTRHSASDSARF